jgi:hypothetical protein
LFFWRWSSSDPPAGTWRQEFRSITCKFAIRRTGEKNCHVHQTDMLWSRGAIITRLCLNAVNCWWTLCFFFLHKFYEDIKCKKVVVWETSIKLILSNPPGKNPTLLKPESNQTLHILMS